MSAGSDTTSFIAPPSTLLSTVTDPTTNQAGYAFPLQTAAWLKMQTIVKTAIAFPLTTADFTSQYGTFTDEAAVTQAVAILGTIQQTTAQYGDPSTLIDQLAAFQQANTPPASIYGNAVWLAAQTVSAAQQIGSLLQTGLTDIAQEPDPATRIQDLTELLTGQGSVSSYATQLQTETTAFQTVISTFYDALNAEISGPTNSLNAYLGQSSNVLKDAKADVTADDTEIDTLTSTIHELNKEYIGFTVAASASPLFMIIPPPFGIALAVADAVTFAVLAVKVKKEMDAMKSQLAGVEQDEQMKAQLVIQLTGFNTATRDVGTDGTDFLAAILQMASGWAAFQSQITLRLTSLTVADVTDWPAFLDKANFQTAIAGWQLIASKAEAFYQAGFVTFTTQPAGS